MSPRISVLKLGSALLRYNYRSGSIECSTPYLILNKITIEELDE
jgi:hypothetical protein